MSISIDQSLVAAGLFRAHRQAAIIKKKKKDFEIFKFKSFNYPSLFLQHYKSSKFSPT